jgi:phosphotransferase family enzyme
VSDDGSRNQEIPLVGGRSTAGVVLVGNTVRRPAGPWSPTVQRFLAHLKRNGCEGAPSPLGFDERGREILEFIPGDVLGTPQQPDEPVVIVPYPDAWRSDDALVAAAALIRSVHDAAQGFSTGFSSWRLYDGAMRTGEIICHADHGPWNCVYRDGRPFALIDWDSCRPDHPLLDLAQAAWNFVPLCDQENAAQLGFESIDHATRLRLFLDAYGLDDRASFFDALVTRKQREVDLPRFWGLDEEAARAFADEIHSEVAWLIGRRSGLDL